MTEKNYKLLYEKEYKDSNTLREMLKMKDQQIDALNDKSTILLQYYNDLKDVCIRQQSLLDAFEKRLDS